MPKATPKTTPESTQDEAAQVKTYRVKPGAGEIHHDGRVYREGDPIELADAAAARLAHLLADE